MEKKFTFYRGKIGLRPPKKEDISKLVSIYEQGEHLRFVHMGKSDPETRARLFVK